MNTYLIKHRLEQINIFEKKTDKSSYWDKFILQYFTVNTHNTTLDQLTLIC